MTSPTIRPARGLWAAVRPSNRGGYWIDHLSVAFTARDARAYAGEYLPGGWPDLRKRGWRIIRVDVIPHEDGKDAE